MTTPPHGCCWKKSVLLFGLEKGDGFPCSSRESVLLRPRNPGTTSGQYSLAQSIALGRNGEDPAVCIWIFFNKNNIL
jgi:hypothetical protein